MADKTRFEIPAKPVHPLGWKCDICFHVVRDPTPGSKALKCVRNPPVPQFVQMGGQQACVSISPPVQPDEWCGEWKRAGANPLDA
jgi:hypothetical protein